MPFPFTPVHIPFVSGARQDLGKLAQDNPSQLRRAHNVAFTKKGHVTGRPGLVSRDAFVQNETGYFGLSGASLLNNTTTDYLGQPTTYTPSGIVAAGFPGSSGTDIETPLVCWQGKSYFKTGSTWQYAGVHWSVRQTKSVALGVRDPSNTNTAAGRGAAVPVGASVVGVVTTAGQLSVVPRLTAQGEYSGVGDDTNSPTLVSLARASATAVAGDAVLWRDGLNGNIIALIPIAGITPAVAVTLASPAGSNNGPVAACTDGTNYYMAYADTTTTAVVKKLSSTGTVLQTLALVWAAGALDGTTAGTLDICYDPTSNRLGLVAVKTTAAVATMTKILTLVGGVMADAGIDLTLTGSTTVAAEAVCCGLTHKGQMSVLFSRAPTNWTTGAATTARSGSLYIGGRSFTAATETSFTTLNGSVNGSGFGQVWDPMFAGRVMANRTLVGVYHGLENSNSSNQWVVLDVSDLYDLFQLNDRRVVAAGALNGVERCIPGSTYSTSSQLAFGISEGTAFAAVPPTTPSVGTGSATTVRRSAVRRITLAPQGVQAAHVNGTTLLSGQAMHTFDGLKIRPHHFVEETPYIFDGGNGFVYTSAGGALLAGSYTYQATWELVNGRGQITRSGASEPLTVTGVTAGQKVSLHVTKPQLLANGTSDAVRVRLWATQANPTNNAAKYLAAETVATSPATGFEVVLVHSTTATGVEEQLYETVDALADMRAPGADRGIAVVAGRAWCADQDRLYASKLLRPGIAVSWNTEGTNVLTLPSSLGTIQGLAAVNEGLVVLCSRGGAVVTGPGVDDTGAGPGWALQIIDGVPGMGVSSPRSLATTPAGVTFQAQDGNIWLANSAGQAIPLSRPVRDSATTSVVDVINVTPTPLTNSMLVAQGAAQVLRVLDLELGQWATWSFPSVTPSNGLFIASINGVLWMQTTHTVSPSVVFSVDDVTSGSDAGVGTIGAVIETGVLRPGGPAGHGWGRLRSVVVNQLATAADATLPDVTVEALADQNERSLVNKTLTLTPSDALLVPNGGDGNLEFRTTVQRCSHVRVILTVAPAVFDIEGLDLWVSNTGEGSPTNDRS